MKRRRTQREPDVDAVTSLAELAERCTPNRWKLRVQSQKLDQPGPPVNTTYAFPADRDLELMIAQQTGQTGTYRVLPLLQVRGASHQAERQLLGLHGSDRRAPAGVVVVNAGDVARAGATVRRGVAAPTPRAQIDADPDVIDAERQARVHEAKARAAKAEAAARNAGNSEGGNMADVVKQLMAQVATMQQQLLAAQAPKTDVAAMLQILNRQADNQLATMQELLRSERERSAQLLQQLAQRDQAPSPELGTIHGQIKTFREIRDAFREEDDSRDDDRTPMERIVAQIADEVLPILAARMAPAAAAVPAPPAVAAPPPPQLVRDQVPEPPAAGVDAIARTRAAAFAMTVTQELLNGSDPEAVADRLSDDVDLLPATVRAPLDRGDWSGAFAGVRALLPAATGQQLADAIDSSPTAAQWLAAFAAACSREDVAHAG